MKGTERLAPVAAALSALGTMACCLPFGFLAALGMAGIARAMSGYRVWLLLLSVIFLGVGFSQLYLGKRWCARRGRISIAIFWLSALLVIIVLLFPQLIATVLASTETR